MIPRILGFCVPNLIMKHVDNAWKLNKSFIEYQVCFDIVTNKFGIATTVNDFLPKFVENRHCI